MATDLKLKFNSNYPKLQNQKMAELIDVWTCDKTDFSKEFIEYDTKKEDGSYYELDDNEYIMLLFLGENLIPFTTIRKFSKKKLDYYNEYRGCDFNLVVEEL